MDNVKFTRQELYNLVWSTPMLTLSKKYNISDVGLRKTCIRMNIPLPKAGHWQRLQFGKKVAIISLPNTNDGVQEITLMLRNADDSKDNKGRSTAIDLQNQIEEELQSKLNVPEKLNNPDKLITAVRNNLINQPADKYSYISTVRSYRDELDIRVGVANVGRVLRFMDTLIKALRLRGHDVQIKNGDSCAVVKEEDFKIQVREKMKKVVVKDGTWDRTVYHPTGILAFQSKSKEWKDGKEKIEEQISKIIAHLEIEGEEWKNRRIKWKKEEEERKEKERLRHEFSILQEKELAKFKEMLSNASRWHKANNLRNYIQAVEEKAVAENNYSEELKDWLMWAKKKADWYDPFVGSHDDMLKGINKETLIIEKKFYYDW